MSRLKVMKSWLLALPLLAVTACGVPETSIEVKTSREAAAAQCEQTGKCIKDPSGLVLYNSDLVTENFILKTPAQSPTLLAKLMNLVDEPKLLVMSGKLDPLIRGVRIVSESEICDSPKGIDGINPTISQLRSFKQGRYKACISYIGDGLFKRVHTLPPIEVDTTAPEVTKDEMTKSVLTAASVSLSWSKSSDNLTPESKLVYSVYVSKTNALDSIDNVVKYGSLVPGVLVGGTSYIVNSLAEDTDYNVAVTVSDEAGNRSLVGHSRFKTLPLDATVPTVTISSDRDPGPTNLTSVLLTIQFSEPVNGFTAAGINVNGATKGQFTAIDSDTYTLALSTTSPTVSAVVPAGSAKDVAGNNSLVSNTWTLAINGAAAAPVASPLPGVYTSAQSVELSSQTPGATIYYTLDNSTPTVGSLVYSAPIFVGVTTTIKALATAPMHNDSAVVNLPFTITGKVQAPSFSVASGSYGPAQTVEISTATPGATIYYTDDNSPPNRGSSRYSAPITISTSKKITAFAVLDGWDDSESSSETYTINGSVAAPEISPVAGTYTTAQSVTLSTATQDATIYYTLDGSPPTTGSTLYTAPIFVQVSQTIRAIAVKTSFIDSTTAEFPYVITGKVQAPNFSVSTGSYGPAQTIEITSSTPGATIYYTSDGSTPTRESARYTSPLVVSTSQIITAFAVLSDWDDSEPSSASYTINGFVDPPSALTQPGIYTSAIEVELSASVSGASIFYTVDGSTPNSFSLLYSAPIFVQVSQTIKAIAVKPNYIDSVPVEFSYTINGTVQKPEFSLPGGSYGPAQSVSMMTPTPNATIYYTTDGSEPTRSSTRYVGAVNVTEPKTIKAFAVFADWADSAVETAQYTINGSVANPVGDPAPDTYNSIQLVRLLTIPADAQIYYTVDGSDPVTSSTRLLYLDALTLNSSTNIKAVASRADFIDSEVVSLQYNIIPAISFSQSSYTLTAGVSNASITPFRTDLPIDSCSIEPALPAGLNFNTSDCSITGTPSYGGPAVSYTITPMNASGVGNAATITIAVNGTDAMGAYYVNGELADGRVADPDPHADKNVLLMHFDGANGSANFADASASNRAVTRNGNAIMSNAQSMFGGSSAYFDGSGSSLWIPAETAFDFNEDFTMEGWFYFVTTNQSNGASVLFSSDVDDNIQLNSELNSNTIRYFSDSWSSYLTATLSSVLASRWVHLAVVRQAGIITIYENGQAVASSYASKQYDVGGLYIGQQNPFRSDHWFHGYMDEIRVTKGIARYTSNFTPSTSAFGDACYTAGVKRACGRADYGCPATGYCTALAMYFVNGVEHPGLSSSGTGISTVDNKYYVNGSLAEGVAPDHNIVLLLHMDGNYGSREFIDSSSSSKMATVYGETYIHSNSRFGSGSAYFDGSGDYLSFSSPSDFKLGTGDFTAELWFNAEPAMWGWCWWCGAYDRPLLTTADPTDADGFLMLTTNNYSNTVRYLAGSNWGWWPIDRWYSNVSSGIWNHYAVSRQSGTTRVFLNGAQVESFGDSTDYTNVNQAIKVGGRSIGGQGFHGYIDEVRVTKGKARYTGSFSPDNLAYNDNACYSAGAERACGPVDYGCPATGYCSALAKYFIDSLEHPGLNSSGTGMSSVNNKYYVDGNLANGRVADANGDGTVLLLHMDGTDGSATFTDSSASNTTVFRHGNSALSAAQSKFGGTSAYFDGASFLRVPDSDSFVLSNSPFSIEAWFRANSLGSDWQTIIQKGWYGSNYSWSILVKSGNIGVFTHNINGDWNFTVSDLNISAEQWNHVALVYTGSEQKIFLNGVQVGAKTAIITDAFADVTIGASNSNNPGDYFNGYIDDLRITKGVARYSSNFTPPTAALGETCYTAGEQRTCNYVDYACSATGYCAGIAKYIIDGVEHPGLTSSGTGTSTVNNKYYVNGNLANGRVGDTNSDGTVLLLHMDGTDGSTTFTDSSPSNITISPTGNSALSAAQSKFGGTSAYFDGNSFLSSQVQSAFDFGTDNFSVEAWIYPTSFGWHQRIAGIGNGAMGGSVYSGWVLSLQNAGQLWFYRYDGNQNYVESTGAVSLNQWNHVAVTRENGLLTFWINGVAAGSFAFPYSLNRVNEDPFGIGYWYSGHGNTYFNGYIDELRISKGIARYTSNFMPPTEPFGTSCYTDGDQRACTYIDYGCQATGYCSGMAQFLVNGVPHPGLNSSGTGISAVNNKYYVNGNLANGLEADSFGRYEAAVKSKNPLTYLKLDETNGDFASDSSGNGGNATYYGGITRSAPGAFTGSNSSVTLDGSSAAIQLTNGLVYGRTSLSVELWFKTQTSGVLFGYQSYPINWGWSPYWVPSIYIDTNGKLRAGFYIDNLWPAQGITSQTVTDNQWHHVVLTISGTNQEFYLDGSLVSSNDFGYQASWIDMSNSQFGWGLASNWPGAERDYFAGSLDEIAIYGTALTGAQVADHYSKHLPSCYTDGEPRACTYADYACSANGYCSGMAKYLINGVPHPGLNSSGTGISTVNNKYYVNGNLANGLVSENDPHSDKTVLLMHMDGADGAQTFSDSSDPLRVVTPSGNARISANQSMFGGKSLYLDGANSWLGVDDNGELNLDDSDFTLEAWIYPTDLGQDNPIWGSLIGQTTNTGYVPLMVRNNGNLHVWFANPSWAVDSGAGLTAVSNRWQHVAAVRSGSTMTVYLDGIASAPFAVSGSVHRQSGASFSIGSFGQEGGAQWPFTTFKGYIDEVRITKGVARYTSNFQPPTASFGNACYTAGVQRACTYADYSCPATGYCAGIDKYVIDGVEHPGLTSSGTGMSSVNNKYYVAGVLANGLVTDPHSDKTVLLMHMDGANGSTTFTDSSASNLTVTPNGNAQISTAQSKFGGASALLPSITTDLISINENQDLTIEMWFYQNNIDYWSQPQILSVSDGFGIYLWDSGPRRIFTHDGTWMGYINQGYYSSAHPSLETWHHLAVTRENGILRTFLDGQLLESAPFTRAISGQFTFGNYEFYGYIDELRISKGIARYTSNFTPPTGLFGDACFTDGVARECTAADY